MGKGRGKGVRSEKLNQHRSPVRCPPTASPIRSDRPAKHVVPLPIMVDCVLTGFPRGCKGDAGGCSEQGLPGLVFRTCPCAHLRFKGQQAPGDPRPDRGRPAQHGHAGMANPSPPQSADTSSSSRQCSPSSRSATSRSTDSAGSSD